MLRSEAGRPLPDYIERARRMAETAALLVDEVLPDRPLRQWVLSLPHALRFLLAGNPAALTRVPGVVYRNSRLWPQNAYLEILSL